MRIRLKKELFDKYQVALLVGEGHASSWGGLKTNPWLEARRKGKDLIVCINNRWWRVDQAEWKIENYEAINSELVIENCERHDSRQDNGKGRNKRRQ